MQLLDKRPRDSEFELSEERKCRSQRERGLNELNGSEGAGKGRY